VDGDSVFGSLNASLGIKQFTSTTSHQADQLVSTTPQIPGQPPSPVLVAYQSTVDKTMNRPNQMLSPITSNFSSDYCTCRASLSRSHLLAERLSHGATPAIFSKAVMHAAKLHFTDGVRPNSNWFQDNEDLVEPLVYSVAYSETTRTYLRGPLRLLGYLPGSTYALLGSRRAIRRVLLHRSVQLPTRRGLLTGRWMTSAYSGDVGDGTLCRDKLSYYVPSQTVVNDRKVEIDWSVLGK
jgi:hypothetical protein